MVMKYLLRFLAILPIVILLMVIMFPMDDVADMISANLSRQGVYTQLDHLSLSFFPGPGFDAENIVIEPRGMPAIRAGAASATVSLMKLITGKIGMSAKLQKIFGGNVTLDYAQDGKAKSGAPFDDINAHAESINLESLMDFLANANMAGPKIRGVAKLDIARLRIDHGFGEQPSGVISLDIPSLSFPAQTLQTQMGPQPIPTLELGRAVLKNAKITDGNLEIPDLTLGDPKGEFFAKIKGTMGLQMMKVGASVAPIVSKINLNMKITADKEFVNHNRDILGSFLLLMGTCKQDTPKGIEVACNVNIPALGQVPSFTPTTEKF